MDIEILEKPVLFFLRQMLYTILVFILGGLPLLFLAWLLESGEPGAFVGMFSYVLSGRIFNEGWNPVHAGFTLDQPTMGKWFFWFTVFTVVGLSSMEPLRRYLVRSSKLRHWIFAIWLSLLCLSLLCLLTIPFGWLIQCIKAEGWTSQRIFGLFYGIGWYAAVLVFWLWATILKRNYPSTGLNGNK